MCSRLLSSRLFLYSLCSYSILNWHKSQHENQMRATQTSNWDWSYDLNAFTPSFPSPETLDNLVKKLFCVCLWTLQSQVGYSKKIQHNRRLHNIRFLKAVVVCCCIRPSPFPLQKIKVWLSHTRRVASSGFWNYSSPLNSIQASRSLRPPSFLLCRS